MKEHRRKIILGNENASTDGNRPIVPSKSGPGDVYQNQRELLSQDKLLTFPLTFRYVFGKRVIPGRA